MSNARASWPLLPLLLLRCTVPPLNYEGKICQSGECPAGFVCVYDSPSATSGLCRRTGCEGPPRACEKDAGLCVGKFTACLPDGGFEPVCSGLSYGAAYESLETRCGDAIDNDCDGRVDRSRAVALMTGDTLREFSLAHDARGYALVFRDQAAAGSTVSYRRFDESLAPVGPRIPLSDPTATAASAPNARAGIDGTAIAWLERVDGGDRVVVAKANLDGGLMPLASGLATSRIIAEEPVRSGPRVASSPDGGWMMVVWVTPDPSSSVNLLKGALFSTAVGSSMLVKTLNETTDDGGLESVESADVATDPGGQFVAGWVPPVIFGPVQLVDAGATSVGRFRSYEKDILTPTRLADWPEEAAGSFIRLAVGAGLTPLAVWTHSAGPPTPTTKLVLAHDPFSRSERHPELADVGGLSSLDLVGLADGGSLTAWSTELASGLSARWGDQGTPVPADDLTPPGFVADSPGLAVPSRDSVTIGFLAYDSADAGRKVTGIYAQRICVP